MQKWYMAMIQYLMVGACVCLLGNQGMAKETPVPTPVGRVVWIQGTLKAIMPNQEERNLKKDSIIYLKDTLITNANSTAQVIFTDQSLMTFTKNTRFFINQYQFSKTKNYAAVKYVMNLLAGGFRTITGLIAKNKPTQYKINTPVATIGIRGTDYAVYLDESGKLFVGYYKGSPCVKTNKAEVCLDAKIPYASASNLAVAPVPLSQQPAIFKEKLLIVPAKMELFILPSPGSSAPSVPSGTVNSICIS